MYFVRVPLMVMTVLKQFDTIGSYEFVIRNAGRQFMSISNGPSLLGTVKSIGSRISDGVLS